MRTHNTILIGATLFYLVSSSPLHGEETTLQHPLTVERLYESPQLSGERPRGLRISPDGKRITFLKGKQENYRIQDLWQYDIEAGKESLLVDSQEILGAEKETLSDEEKAQRERQRIFASGIVRYQWSKQGDKILFPINGDIYIYQLDSDTPVKRITHTDASELDAGFSPKGNYISFVRNHNVYVVNLDDLKETQITFDGTKENPMGVAEFIAQEEMRRHRGYWWSPNEKYLAVAQVDNTPVGTIERFEVYPEKISLIEQRYPKAGTANAVVRLAIVNISEPALQIQVPIEQSDYYIPQIKWLPAEKNSTLSYSIQSRDQKKLTLWSYNVDQKKRVKLLEETDPAWVNIRHDYLFLKDTRQLLWVSEKSGHSHIHLYDWAGNEVRAVTSGEWEVLRVQAFDERNNKLYFSANKSSPLETHLYVVEMKDGALPKKISREEGSHRITMPEKPEFYIDSFSSVDQPFQVSVHSLDGERSFYITENIIDAAHPLKKYASDLSEWEFGEYLSESGHLLYYKILKPPNFSSDRKYPLVQFVYGGPGPQLVRKSWGDLYHQLLAQQGFVVLVADNRGTRNRGREFERAFYLKFGDLEVKDQAAVLEHVSSKFNFIDSNRVGVYGHSYGGYLTLMLMLQKPDLYQVGVASAPVVDWTLYDTHYTERYLGKPQDNEEVYKKSNVTTFANNLKGRLLMIHGMADDNVLYNHSLLLYQALQENGKPFDIMVYPGAKHGIRGKKEWELHFRNSNLNYLTEHLLKD